MSGVYSVSSLVFASSSFPQKSHFILFFFQAGTKWDDDFEELGLEESGFEATAQSGKYVSLF